MLNSGDPVNIAAWKADGTIVRMNNAVSLSFDYRGGWRNVKLLGSGEVRRVRDALIFEVNDCEVFL